MLTRKFKDRYLSFCNFIALLLLRIVHVLTSYRVCIARWWCCHKTPVWFRRKYNEGKKNRQLAFWQRKESPTERCISKLSKLVATPSPNYSSIHQKTKTTKMIAISYFSKLTFARGRAGLNYKNYWPLFKKGNPKRHE